MPIIKQISAPNGVALAFHKPKSAAVDFAAGTAVVSVQSWPTEQAYLDGAPPAWSQPVPMAVAGLSDVEAGLLQSGWLAGGTSVPDEAASLDSAKARAWARVKDERTARLAGTFEHDGNVYDIDPLNITGAALDAQLAITANEAWEQAWVLANNTIVTLTPEEMIAVGRACKAAVSSLWAVSQYLRGLIEAVQPGPNAIAEVEAITWP